MIDGAIQRVVCLFSRDASIEWSSHGDSDGICDGYVGVLKAGSFSQTLLFVANLAHTSDCSFKCLYRTPGYIYFSRGLSEYITACRLHYYASQTSSRVILADLPPSFL